MKKIIVIVLLAVLVAMSASLTWSEQRLNNLVVELVNRTKVKVGQGTQIAFTNPYDGWVFFAITAKTKDMITASVHGSSGSADVIKLTGNGGIVTAEGMRLLKKGDHLLTISVKGRPSISKIIIRAVPELIYCQYPVDPHISLHNRYDWKFLSKYVLPQANCMISSDMVLDFHESYLKQWVDMGGKWVFHGIIPGMTGPSMPITEAYNYWYKHPGYQENEISGIICDEFFGDFKDNKYGVYTDALAKIYEDKKMADKTFYAWGTFPMYNYSESKAFADMMFAHNGKVAMEYYISERKTMDEAVQAISSIKNDVDGWNKAYPNTQPKGARNVIAVPGYMSQPNESLNTDPTIDFKVFMDRMMYMFANDPTFEGMYGIMWYLSPYTDEETIRWGAALLRHYGIEGNKTMLSDKYGYKYNLNYIVNPDFEDGTKGWTVKAAEEGSAKPDSLEGWSWIEGRYPRTKMGDTFLNMKYSDKGPNTVSQEIKNLIPGKMYSLKMMTGDKNDIVNGISRKMGFGGNIKIDNVDFVPERCFEQLIDNCYSHHLGKFNDVNKAWFSYHWVVFKAKGTTAKLTISDWSNSKQPWGKVGRELMLNFIEVQPYFEP